MIVLYTLAPTAAQAGNRATFVAMICIIISMYGGGFSNVPTHLADLFGTRFVGTIHGRLLTAWATAGIVAPVVVDYIRKAQIETGVSREQVNGNSMHILAAFLAVGLIVNALVRPANPKWYIQSVRDPKSRDGTLQASPESHGIDRAA